MGNALPDVINNILRPALSMTKIDARIEEKCKFFKVSCCEKLSDKLTQGMP